MRVLVIDNYDSFTYNLVHLFEELGADVVVYRNDAITVDQAEALAPSHLVVSPGPGRPADAGVSVELVRRLGPRVPTLGVLVVVSTRRSPRARRTALSSKPGSETTSARGSA